MKAQDPSNPLLNTEPTGDPNAKSSRNRSDVEGGRRFGEVRVSDYVRMSFELLFFVLALAVVVLGTLVGLNIVGVPFGLSREIFGKIVVVTWIIVVGGTKRLVFRAEAEHWVKRLAREKQEDIPFAAFSQSAWERWKVFTVERENWWMGWLGFGALFMWLFS